MSCATWNFCTADMFQSSRQHYFVFHFWVLCFPLCFFIWGSIRMLSVIWMTTFLSLQVLNALHANTKKFKINFYILYFLIFNEAWFCLSFVKLIYLHTKKKEGLTSQVMCLKCYRSITWHIECVYFSPPHPFNLPGKQTRCRSPISLTHEVKGRPGEVLYRS